MLRGGEPEELRIGGKFVVHKLRDIGFVWYRNDWLPVAEVARCSALYSTKRSLALCVVRGHLFLDCINRLRDVWLDERCHRGYAEFFKQTARLQMWFNQLGDRGFPGLEKCRM